MECQRTFPKYLTDGSPNLLVVPPGDASFNVTIIIITNMHKNTDDILKTALSLYMEDHQDHPLPTLEEVLICTSSTTAEEV